ncbi:hypothetical protein EV368DRAFT_38532, partial [Lentinula lateritia]
SLRAVVTDGVTLGHPCCKVHNCTEPLQNNCHHWCKTHMEQQHVCIITDCNHPTRSGHRTCNDTAHRKYEEYQNLKGKGFFLLRTWLQCVRVQQPSTSLGLDSVVEENLAELLDIDGDDPIDPAHELDNGNRPSKAMFAHSQTHNEQLVVCSCGIILA